MASCTKCGFELSDTDRYCTKCGAPIGASKPNNENRPIKHDTQEVSTIEKFTVRQRLRRFFLGTTRGVTFFNQLSPSRTGLQLVSYVLQYSHENFSFVPKFYI